MFVVRFFIWFLDNTQATLVTCLALKVLCASQVAQWSRTCLPVKQIQVWSLGQEDPLEEEMATLPRKSHGQMSLVGYSPRSHKRVRYGLQRRSCKSWLRNSWEKDTVFVLKCQKLMRNGKWNIWDHIRKLKSDLLSQCITALLFIKSSGLLKWYRGDAWPGDYETSQRRKGRFYGC